MKFPTQLTTGSLFQDRYRIISLIGSGGMSRVYLAEDLRLPGKYWAIKESVANPQLSGDVQAEAELLIALSHPHLPRITDFYPPDTAGYCYLVMDYIEGVTLEEYTRSCGGPLPAQEIIRHAFSLLEVLDYLHCRRPPVIYRDLKPGNVMLTGDGHLMLIDFGIARSYKHEGEEDTVKLGTVGFAAPEQFGSGQSGPATDLYGLGALMLYMASGGKWSHWQPGLESRLDRRLPSRLIPVIRKLLRHHPEERYQSAREVQMAMDGLRAHNSSPKGGLHEEINSHQPSTVATGHRPFVVGVLGIAPGLGTTFTSFAAARYLTRSGSVSWLEWNPEGTVYNRMAGLLEGSVPAGGRLIRKGVELWPCLSGHGRGPGLSEQNIFTVLDMGTGNSEQALQQFAACDVRVLVASGADWRLEELLRWLQHSGIQADSRLRIALPLADRRTESLLQEALPRAGVYAVPPSADPFTGSGILGKAMGRLFTGIPGIRRTRFAKANGRL
ncbi:serine/threonine-protein kinase [Paenibacillus tepidiphilus]|uniref:serine/threonine-protein kinase n=1 Tax=Paenibacillus tepidiphilus TaxID=2608683 RepID=UPI0013A57A45|nr:serine/threonine-protein kinase [Paenibacillus tepidiphilus]